MPRVDDADHGRDRHPEHLLEYDELEACLVGVQPWKTYRHRGRVAVEGARGTQRFPQAGLRLPRRPSDVAIFFVRDRDLRFDEVPYVCLVIKESLCNKLTGVTISRKDWESHRSTISCIHQTFRDIRLI